MAKNRYVNTHFWNDSYVVELSPSEKLIFLYLLTNPLTNSAGIYEITTKRIAFDTGLNQPAIKATLDKLQNDGKVVFLPDCNWIILINFLKNQNLNGNMKAGVESLIGALPISVKSLLEKGSGKALKGFESLSNALKDFNLNLNLNLNYKVDSAILSDRPESTEKEGVVPFQDFYRYYPRKEGRAAAEKSWNKIKASEKPGIIEALKKQIAASHINTTEKQFCPLPATWLNGRRWEDVITSKASATKVPSLFPKKVFCKYCEAGYEAGFTISDWRGVCPHCQRPFYVYRDNDKSWHEAEPPAANMQNIGSIVQSLSDKFSA